MLRDVPLGEAEEPVFVDADLDVMDRDARKMRGERPFVFANIKPGEGWTPSEYSSSAAAGWDQR